MRTPLVILALAAAAATVSPSGEETRSMFAYDRGRPFDVSVVGSEPRGAAIVTDLTYSTLTRTRRAASLAPLDPTRHLANAGALPLLFQFATRDRFVTTAAAEAIVASAKGPKDVRWYDAEHGLNADATRDRLAWLRQHGVTPK